MSWTGSSWTALSPKSTQSTVLCWGLKVNLEMACCSWIRCMNFTFRNKSLKHTSKETLKYFKYCSKRMYWVWTCYQQIQSLSRNTKECKIYEPGLYQWPLQDLTQHHYSENLCLWSFIVTSVVNLSRNFPPLLMFLRYQAYVICCAYLHFSNWAYDLLLLSTMPAMGMLLSWALSHTPSLQCLDLTSLCYSPVVLLFLANSWRMCSEVLPSQGKCHLATCSA